jgi:hypothetical protein
MINVLDYEIERLLSTMALHFFHCLDHGLYDELAALFEQDGVFDKVGIILDGRAAIREAMENRKKNVTRHMVSNLRWTARENAAVEATMYAANFHGAIPERGLPVVHAKPNPAMVEFTFLFRNTANGWAIARLTACLVIAG